ncbi:hypothetical protein AAFF_G00336280 [Aldrovandia affinis]|uniref:Mitochondrial inner membrane protein OXA1L n=1 Tax=Aldrovandia affinis TaxID=143900 RepID=A0AAD7R6J4_9TELE|nr:hypothetical protein AAFF_G00336280 [Aldrovandia affinis]
MAALVSRASSCSLAACFLGRTHRSWRGAHRLTETLGQCLLQESSLHTLGGNRGHVRRPRPGLHHNGRFLLVSAVPIRNNSSQMPVEAVAAPVPAQDMPISTIDTAPILTPDTSPIADHASLLAQPIAEQAAEAAPTALEVLQGAGPELSLSELGLGSHTPWGLIQNILEFIHVDVGLPWWGAIVLGTVLARCAVFPVIVKGQREAAKLNNVLPEMTRLTNRMNEAKRSGNKFECHFAYSDMMLFQKKHDVNPCVASWCRWCRHRSSSPDPFYILPLAVTGTMFAILELGAESGIDNPNLRAMKTVFRIMPFVILPLTINFPTAVFTYWLTSNVFSLGQVALLRHPAVRQRLRIPERVTPALRHASLRGLPQEPAERLEERSARPTAGGEREEDQKPFGNRSKGSSQADLLPQPLAADDRDQCGSQTSQSKGTCRTSGREEEAMEGDDWIRGREGSLGSLWSCI